MSDVMHWVLAAANWSAVWFGVRFMPDCSWRRFWIVTAPAISVLCIGMAIFLYLT